MTGLEGLEIDAAGENGLGDLTRLASLGFEVWVVDNVQFRLSFITGREKLLL